MTHHDRHTRRQPPSAAAVRGDFVPGNFGVMSISIVFGLLFVFFSVQADAFLTANNLVNVLRQVAPTVIVAMAMTFVITTGRHRPVGRFDRRVSPRPRWRCWPRRGNPVLALRPHAGDRVGIGVVNGALTAYGRLQSFIVTLAALTAVRGIALLITNGYSTPITSTFLLPLGQGKLLGLYTPTWIAHRHRRPAAGTSSTRPGSAGTSSRVGSNAESLRRSGVDVRGIQLAALDTDRRLRGRGRHHHGHPAGQRLVELRDALRAGGDHRRRARRHRA